MNGKRYISFIASLLALILLLGGAACSSGRKTPKTTPAPEATARAAAQNGRNGKVPVKPEARPAEPRARTAAALPVV
ncbi:MAG TPA: hypothetical protein VHP61_03335, partial [Acidobacteriota bacterium]|nr:hypothetical protein [Acidobacteriota bacterium]